MSDEEPTEESLRERIDTLADRLEEAETEDDLDEIEADIDELEADIEAADLPMPEPEEDEEEDDVTPPEEELTDDLDDLRDDVDDQRGPYAEDVVDAIEDAISTVESEEWLEETRSEVTETTADAVEQAADELDTDIDVVTIEKTPDGEYVSAAVDMLGSVVDAVEAADLDPDDDAEVIAAMLDWADELEDDLGDIRTWDDLTVREKLDRHGFYDVLDHRKDFPPEWNAIKVYEDRGEPEPILLALDLLGSEFMEEHCLESLDRMGPEEALDDMEPLAQRRNEQAISVLGSIGSEEAVDTVLDHVDSGTLSLRTTAMDALGDIGSEEATQTIANQLVDDDPTIRSTAARALGRIGDTRAIEPLADILEDSEEEARVRASAAWALNQIQTEDALEIVADYEDDESYLVQSEAEKAADVESTAAPSG
jgi:HEAT repeat protein